jgi:co-chaperonin GroES (HSP10)
MASRIKQAKPSNNYVLIRFQEVNVEPYEKSNGGILVPNQEQNNSGKSKKHKAYIEDVGPSVNTEERGFRVGDEVIFNEYDLKQFGDADQTFGLVKDENVMAVIQTEEE